MPLAIFFYALGKVFYAGGGERFGSGDGEREASMTRQMPYEPLPASVLCVPSMGTVQMGFKSPV